MCNHHDDQLSVTIYKMTQQYINNYPVVMDFKDRLSLIRGEIVTNVHIETSSIDPQSDMRFGLGCIMKDTVKYGYVLIYNKPFFHEIVFDGLPQMVLVNCLMDDNQLYIVGCTIGDIDNKTKGIIIRYDIVNCKVDCRVCDDASDFLSINKDNEKLFIIGNNHKGGIITVEIDTDLS